VKRAHWQVTPVADDSASDEDSEEKEQSDFEVRRRIRPSPKKKSLVKKSSSKYQYEKTHLRHKLAHRHTNLVCQIYFLRPGKQACHFGHDTNWFFMLHVG